MTRATPADQRPDTGATVLPDVLAFMQVLWALVHRLDTTSKRMSRHVGVTGPQRLALRVVGLFPGVSAGDVATILHVHPSTLTGVLQRLAARKLVVRHRDQRDGRRAVLRLTPKGQLVNAASAGTVESAVSHTLKQATDSEIAVTKRLLSRLSDQLDAQADSPRSSRNRGRLAAARGRDSSSRIRQLEVT